MNEYSLNINLIDFLFDWILITAAIYQLIFEIKWTRYIYKVWDQIFLWHDCSQPQFMGYLRYIIKHCVRNMNTFFVSAIYRKTSGIYAQGKPE